MNIDLMIWLLAGLIAGGLAGAIWSGTTRAVRWAALHTGVFGALAGGWIVDSLLGLSSLSFLGSVCLGVLCALLTSALLRRSDHARYHT
jgi:uncharacterized membrane protein YeaQ/YmgE (transglycosylase-associated protein family)